jgi:hypothetical protein
MSRGGPIPDDVRRRWKYHSLEKGCVWTGAYNLLPDDIIAKLTECIVNKPCIGRQKTPMNKYKSICIPVLLKWVVEKKVIPHEIAFRLQMKLSTRDLERLQLIDAVSKGLASADALDVAPPIIPNQQQPVESMDISHDYQEHQEDTPQASGAPSNNEQEDDESVEDCADYSFTPTEFSTLQEFIPSIRYDVSGNEIDPLTGFAKPKITLAKVLHVWKKRELEVCGAPVTRLLRLLNQTKPEISKRDYAARQLPKTCATLMKTAESKNTYIIRKFHEYDYKADDFPENAGTTLPDSDSDDSDEENPVLSDNGSDDQSSDDDEDTNGIEVVQGIERIPQIQNDGEDSGNEGDRDVDDRDDEGDEFVPMPDIVLPATVNQMTNDVTDTMEDLAAKGVVKDTHEMVYLGLENILTLSNTAGNIQKGAYVNYLRAIALLDQHALTDDLVNRLFPPNSKVPFLTSNM